MKLLSIYLKNFKSFKEPQILDFPREPGLYFLWGDNQAEPRLGGNGVGKTTLWDAVTWVLYGKTTRGLKAGDVAHWDVTKGTTVSMMVHTERHGIVKVERTWAPNTWTMQDLFGHSWDLAKDETNHLLAELRLDFEPFLCSILMAQGRPMFLDLKADAKSSLFTEVLALERWTEYARRASEHREELDRSLRRVEQEVAKHEGALRLLSDTTNADRKERWDIDKKAKLDRLEGEYGRMLDRLEKVKADLVAAETDNKDARQAYREALDTADDHAKTCDKCGQHLPNPYASKAKHMLERLEASDARLRTARREVEQVERVLDDMEARYNASAAEVNPYKEVEEDRARQLAKGNAALEALRLEADDLSHRMSLASHWSRWFKEIRLAQVAESLEELEVEVNSCVAALGLVGWEILFDVDRETKGGTIQRGFAVSVRSPSSSRPVPWEAWSGGESQRLRVAGNMGLSNLIRSRSGTALAVEVWDEPTNWMSPAGVNDLLACLAERARVEQRQIWVLDHRTLGFAGFSGAYGVVKTDQGSRFVVGDPYSSAHELPHPSRRPASAVRRRPVSA